MPTPAEALAASEIKPSERHWCARCGSYTHSYPGASGWLTCDRCDAMKSCECGERIDGATLLCDVCSERVYDYSAHA